MHVLCTQVCSCWSRPEQNETQQIELVFGGEKTPPETQSEWGESQHDIVEEKAKVTKQSDRPPGIQWKLLPSQSGDSGGTVPLYVRQKQ